MELGISEDDNEYSAEGTMLHTLFLTGKRPAELTGEQVETLDAADFYANEFFGNFRHKFNIPLEATFYDERETPLMLKSAIGGNLYPGHADVIRNWPAFNMRAIADAKFGVREVEAAPDSLQLASYAVSRFQQSPCEAIGVAIIQPRNFGPRFSQAFYMPASIPAAGAELEAIYRSSLEPTAPLRAGESQCHHCKAKVRCVEYKAKFMGITYDDEYAVDTLAPIELEKLHTAIAFAMKIQNEVYGEMRERIERGRLPGWKLQNTGDVTRLGDALGLFSELTEFFKEKKGFTAAAFDSCREMGWEKLAALVQQVGSMSEKKAKELIKSLSAPYVTRTPKAKRIVRDKDFILNPALPAQPTIDLPA